MAMKWTATAVATMALALTATHLMAQTQTQGQPAPGQNQPNAAAKQNPPVSGNQAGANPTGNQSAKSTPQATSNQQPTNAHTADRHTARTFIHAAMQGDLAEIRMGRLAERRGGSARVKDFGRTLVSDHRADYRKAVRVGISVGAAPALRPNAEQRRTYQRLAGLSGARFDREFAHHMVQDHENDIRKLRQAANQDGGRVAAYARNALPTLRKHLSLARAIAASDNGGPAMSSHRTMENSQASRRTSNAPGTTMGGGNRSNAAGTGSNPAANGNVGASGAGNAPGTNPPQSGTANSGQTGASQPTNSPVNQSRPQ